MFTPCIWSELFDDNERVNLQEGFAFAGLTSVMLGFWLNLTLLLSQLRFDQSYRNLANFTLTACIRRAVPVISHLSFIKYIERIYGVQSLSCNLFGFLETFLAVFEVECLTHVCIERYVVAKYINNGWATKRSHYRLYLCLCSFFAVLYSFPPLFGLGKFGYDFCCTSCTFDMVLPNTWQRYLVIMIFLLRSVKPAFVMIMMLTWARIMEGKNMSSKKTNKDF